MKGFLKSLWEGIVFLSVVLLVAVVGWLFLTLGVCVVILASPIWLVVGIVLSYKARGIVSHTEEFLGELERMLDDAEK